MPNFSLWKYCVGTCSSSLAVREDGWQVSTIRTLAARFDSFMPIPRIDGQSTNSRAASVSRAVLAKRFVELVGESPMHYLAGWLIHLAKRLLRDGVLSVGEIAGRVGYESEAAFNRAFRRLAGLPPAAWRQAESKGSGS